MGVDQRDVDSILTWVSSAHSGDVKTMEVEVRRADGRHVVVEFGAIITQETGSEDPRIVGILRDVTAKRNSSGRASLAMAIVQASQDAITGTDINGHVTLWNPGAERMFGYRAEEILGTVPLQLLPFEDQDAYEALRKKVHAGIDVADQRMRLLGRAGGIIEASVSASPLRGDKGKITGAVSITRDISAQEEQKRELEGTLDALRAALRSVDSANTGMKQFVANMSHEIRSPLNAVTAVLQLLEFTRLDAAQRIYLERASSSVRMLVRFVDDTLDVARIQAERLSVINAPIDLPGLVREVEAELRLLMKGSAVQPRIEVVQPVPSWIIGDAHRLRQILSNLLSNAAKYTRRGEISLTVAATPGARQEVTNLYFTVADSGLGIPADHQEKIFDAFYQGDNSLSRDHGGSGLGLFIARSLARLMGGDLVLEHSDSTGSRFVLTVAAKLAPNQDAAPVMRDAVPDAAQRARALAGVRLLVAEDYKPARDTVRDLLEAHGALVDVAENGEMAVARARNCDYTAVLLDVQMPVMDGYQAVRILRSMENYVEKPIIAITGFATPDDVQTARESGFTQHVTKPLDIRALVVLLRSLCNVHDIAPPATSAPAAALPPAVTAADVSAAATRADGAAVLDVRGAMSRLGGIPAIYIKLGRDFMASLDTLDRDICESILSGDDASARKMAHTLKGGALSLGATELAEAFKTCERRLANGAGLDDGARADLVGELQGAARRAVTAMQEAIGRLEAPPAN